MSAYDVFISYKVEDVVAVRAIVAYLQLAGLRVWFDEEIILTSNDDIHALMERGIEDSDYAILCLAPSYMSSPMCQKEMSEIEEKKPGEKIVRLNLHDFFRYRTSTDAPSVYAEQLPKDKFNELLAFLSQTLKRSIPCTELDDAIEQVGDGQYEGHRFRHDLTGWRRSSDMNFFEREVGGGKVSVFCGHRVLRDDERLARIHRFEVHHREILTELKASVHGGGESPPGKCIGIHIMPIGDRIHTACSFEQPGGHFLRVYHVQLPEPGGNRLHQFVFSFQVEGSRNAYLAASVLMDSLVSSFSWPAVSPEHGRDLIRRAYNRVEVGMQMRGRSPKDAKENFDAAIAMLQEAIALDPKLADAYNELGFIHNVIGEHELAASYAKSAFDLEPMNDKFFASLLSSQFGPIASAGFSNDGDARCRSLIQEIDARSSGYAPLCILRAKLLAHSGAPRTEWIMEARKCGQRYAQSEKAGSGIEFRTADKKQWIEARVNNLITTCEQIANARARAMGNPWRPIIRRRPGRPIIRWIAMIAVGTAGLLLVPHDHLRSSWSDSQLSLASCTFLPAVILGSLILRRWPRPFLLRVLVQLPLLGVACLWLREFILRR